jgi:hypothetical protein
MLSMVRRMSLSANAELLAGTPGRAPRIDHTPDAQRSDEHGKDDQFLNHRVAYITD